MKLVQIRTGIIVGWFVACFCSVASVSLLAEEQGTTVTQVVLPKDTLPEKIDLAQVRKRQQSLDPKHQFTDRFMALNPNAVALGRRLFFDPVLSKDRTVSCASCHQPEHGFASPDEKAVGIGGQVGARNAPSLFNRGFGKSQFWDGRAPSLEAQALEPIANQRELGHSVAGVIERITKDPEYRKRFSDTFGSEGADEAESVTSENLARALAAFQRTLILADSPVDRFQAGDYDALTMKERQGLWIFESRGGCWQCHSGNHYTDEDFHNTGIGFGDENRDLGRFAATEKEADKGKFKTPTLRGVVATAPYMHDGSLATLREVIEFYDQGGESDDPNVDSKLKPLGLSNDEIDQLVAFLKALSRS